MKFILVLALFGYDIPPVQLNIVPLEKTIAQAVDGWLGPLDKPAQLDLANDCESFDRTTQTYALDYDPLAHLLQYQGLARYEAKFHATFLAHEYGHVVFRTNIARVSTAIDGDLARSIQYRELARQELHQTSSTHCERSSEQDSPELAAFRKQLTDNDYFTFDALKLGAYDELFADIVAVLYTGQPDAVYQAVGGSKVKWSDKYGLTLPPDYRGRDFTYAPPIAGWRSDHPTIAFYDFVGSVSDFYNVLDPARGYLWIHYLKNLPPDQYAAFFQGYFEAVGEQFTRFQNEQIWDEPVEDMNTRFVASIDRRMHALGVTKF